MHLNTCQISVASFLSAEVGDEVIIYLEEAQKVITLNQTANAILNVIIQYIHNDIDIDTITIARILMDAHKYIGIEIAELHDDVAELIEIFFRERLLIKT